MNKTYLLLAMLFTSLAGYSQQYAIVEDKPIFDGNDIISYYDGEVIKGKEEFKGTYDSLTLYFSSVKNLTRFMANPEKYMPEFGGWCAAAMSMNTLLVPNYNFYKVEDDKLLFFAIQAFLNARTLWERDTVANFQNAVTNYEHILENETASN